MHYIRTFFISLCIVLLALGILFGGIYLFSIQQEDTSVIPPVTNITPTVTRNTLNTYDDVFPAKLIAEKNISVVESFSVDTKNQVQYTYRYITKLSAVENYTQITSFMDTEGWKRGTPTQFTSGWSVDFFKGSEVLSVTYSVNTQTKAATIDLTLLTYK